MKKKLSDKPEMGSPDPPASVPGQVEGPVESLVHRFLSWFFHPSGLFVRVSGTILAALAVVYLTSLIYQQHPTTNPQSSPTNPKPLPSESNASPDPEAVAKPSPFPSFEAYIQARKKVEDRNLERELFDKALVGKSVSWVGTLRSISNMDNSSNEELMVIVMSKKNPKKDFAAMFSEKTWSTFLYSLHNGDTVQIEGTIIRYVLGPFIQGTKIQRVK